MLVQDLCTDFVQGALHSLDLPDYVNAIRIIFQHALHTAQMALGCFQSFDRFCMIMHAAAFLYPTPPGGVYIV
jgi:hypothetical protein